MKQNIIPTPNFKKSTKKLLKKYKLLLNDLENFNNKFEDYTNLAIDLGGGCYKVRLENSSIPTGKSGGFRIIYFYKYENDIYLLEIYSKTQFENISDDKILDILKKENL